MSPKRKKRRPAPGPQLWYDSADLMRLFSISERTVDRWVASGELPKAAKIGRKWRRWPRSKIDPILRRLGIDPDEIDNKRR